jgi:type I restriction enzyme, S subunit
VNAPLRATRGQLPWPRVRLGELAEHRLGKMLDKAKNTGVPRRYLRNPNVRWFDVDLSDLHEILVEEKDVHKYELQYGDVIICEGGEAGRAALWKDEAKDIIFQKACHRVRVGPKLDARFLIHRLMFDYFNGGLDDYYTGATIKHFTGQDLARYEIPLPPLDEQRRIAAILDKADTLRRKRKRTLELLDSLAQSIFLEMFGSLTTNSLGWETVNIDDACELIVDCVNRTAPVVESVTPYKMIRTTNVRNGRVDLLNVRYVSKETFTRWNRRATPREGDVLLTREAPVGGAGLLRGKDNVFLGQRLMLYRPQVGRLTSNFLVWSFHDRYLQLQFDRMSSGSTVKHLPLPACRAFELRLPPYSVQMEFSRRLKSSKHVSELATDQGASFSQLFSSLQHRAFSGQL